MRFPAGPGRTGISGQSKVLDRLNWREGKYKRQKPIGGPTTGFAGGLGEEPLAAAKNAPTAGFRPFKGPPGRAGRPFGRGRPAIELRFRCGHGVQRLTDGFEVLRQ